MTAEVLPSLRQLAATDAEVGCQARSQLVRSWLSISDLQTVLNTDAQAHPQRLGFYWSGYGRPDHPDHLPPTPCRDPEGRWASASLPSGTTQSPARFPAGRAGGMTGPLDRLGWSRGQDPAHSSMFQLVTEPNLLSP